VNRQGLRVTPFARAADWNSVVAVEQTLVDPWTPRGLEEELAQPAGWQMVVRPADSETVLAYVFGRTVVDEAEILRLAVLPAARRQGVAFFLLRHLLGCLCRQEVRVCHLEVRADNHEAIRLYEKMGFVVTGRRCAYYAVPPEDAVLMVKELKN
jgi:ribosomal-protein-alanine N-acetyltransferase